MTSNENRKTVSGFEKLIFSITRGFALCASACVVIGIVILLVMLLMPQSKSVSYSDVAKQLSSEKTPSDKVVQKLPEVPADLKEEISPENEEVVHGWIKKLSYAEQKDFMENLFTVARKAKANNIEISDAMNTYREIYFEKASEDAVAKYTAIAIKTGCVAGVLVLLLILSVLSLVLVMLAIERNTRPVST